jgi:Amino acid synthesis
MQAGPRTDEIFFALVMGTGGRAHSRSGGLTPENIVVLDGQR